jgi:hypothetical protein
VVPSVVRSRFLTWLVAVIVVGVVGVAACKQATFESPEKPDLYKPVHEYDLAVPLAETGEDLAVPGSQDLKTGATDLAKPDSDAGL